MTRISRIRKVTSISRASRVKSPRVSRRPTKASAAAALVRKVFADIGPPRTS